MKNLASGGNGGGQNVDRFLFDLGSRVGGIILFCFLWVFTTLIWEAHYYYIDFSCHYFVTFFCRFFLFCSIISSVHSSFPWSFMLLMVSLRFRLQLVDSRPFYDSYDSYDFIPKNHWFFSCKSIVLGISFLVPGLLTRGFHNHNQFRGKTAKNR